MDNSNDTTLKDATTVSPQQVLLYWFGDGPEYEWRGGLWWRGVDPSLGVLDAEGNKLPAKEMAARTDAYIHQVYGPVLETLMSAASDEPRDLPAPLQHWLGSTDGKVALVILTDQFCRNAFRGTGRMFALDGLARRVAQEVIKEARAELPWPHRMFLAVALMHAEDMLQAEEAAYELRMLVSELEQSNPKISNRLQTTHHQCLEHISVLRRFGRYPHRNALLDRQSTNDEQEYLRSKKLHVWAQSTRSNAGSTTDSAGVDNPQPKARQQAAPWIPGDLRRPLRLLVLPSNRQTRVDFMKRTRPVFVQGVLGEVADVVYAEAPHEYVPSGEAGRAANGIDVARLGGSHRCWWNATDDPATMVYRGLEESIAYIDRLFETAGPFDGIVGFSQGGCLAGIIAALQHQVSPLVRHVNIRFAVIISGFYCRDTRPAFATLHKDRPHEPIDIPSFHVWGTNDKLVDNARSEHLAQCFKDGVVVTHDSDHYVKAIKHWPVNTMTQWLQQFVDKHERQSGLLNSDIVPVMQADVTGMTFDERLNATFQLNRAAFRSNNHTAPLLPIGLSFPELLDTPFWKSVTSQQATLRSGTIRPQEAQEFVSSAFSKHAADCTSALVADLMLLAWCAYPYPHTSPAKQRKAVRRAITDEQGAVFVWLWLAIFQHAPELCIQEHLPLIVNYGSWHDYEKLDLVAAVGTFDKVRDVPAQERFELPKEAAVQIHHAIVASFADQLQKDLQVAATLEHHLDGISATDDDSRWAQMVKIRLQLSLDESNRHISPCFKFVPRFKQFTDRKTRLANDIALKLDAMAHTDTDVNTNVALPDHATVVRSKRLFVRTLATLRDLYAFTHPSDHTIQLARASHMKDWSRRMYTVTSDEHLTELLAAPLSDFVVNPQPDPVDVAPPEELAPLHSFFQSAQPLPQTPDGRLTFTRGTICQDGRLDLCKQVVGPRGVGALMQSLELDAKHQRMIQHLLLGNNICGDELALKAAELIRKGASALTTYYIAGNCMTGEGIEPLCDALATETLVKQLWLKRNPLKATGARAIARMLSTNTTLQVLDLATTGLLNNGFQALLNGLKQNSTLQHLYLAGNGIDAKALDGVPEYFEHHCHLSTLSIGCNRLGDAGAIVFADALQRNSSIQRFEMASCGVGSKGATAFAEMLKTNTTLLHLDLGCLTMTFALQEVPNRVSVEGALAFADALRVNTTLRSLVLFHNAIFQQGVDAFRAVLCDEEGRNTSLVHLELEQLGVPHNELSREDIRYALKRNYLALTAAERAVAEEAVDPAHHKEISSVYRMNGTYKGTTAMPSTISSAFESHST